MSRTPWILPILIPLLAMGSESLAASRGMGTIAQGSKISVLVYNYAHVSEGPLGRAKRTVAEISRQAGVEIVWRDCRPALTMDLRDASAAPPAGKGDLVLRIVPRFEHAPGRTRKETLGLSFGNMAMISLQALRDEAASGDATPEEILGAAIAHELGHLMLGPDSHSERGIMRPHWRREDFERGPHGGLAFTSEQAQLIRIDARRRIQE